MLSDPQFGVVGLALLPLVFFYVSTKLSEQYKFLVIFFFSLGILSAFMTLATIMQSMPSGPLNDAFAWLNYGIMALWIFYLVFVLIDVGIIWVVNLIRAFGQRGKGGKK